MIALKCPICGAPLPPSKTKPRKFCSKKCANKARNMGLTNMMPDEIARMFDAPPLARRRIEIGQETAPITVEEREFRNSELGQIVRVRIETRGRVPCGSFCPRFVGRN